MKKKKALTLQLARLATQINALQRQLESPVLIWPRAAPHKMSTATLGRSLYAMTRPGAIPLYPDTFRRRPPQA